MNYNKKVVFKKTALAACTALYFGATGQAVAEVGFSSVEGTSLKVPTFTKADIDSLATDRAEFEHSDLYAGQAGSVNRVIKQLSPQQIFQPEQDATGIKTYIVQLDDKPLAAYKGGIDGLAATAAPKNDSLMAKGRVNVNSAAAHSYKSYIAQRQDTFINNVTAAGAKLDVIKQFHLANNALVVDMTQQDAIIMSKQSGVKRISENRIFELQSDRGPEFIGSDEMWSGSATPDSLPVQGEGMVVGIIDTGINTDHVAFASDEAYEATNPFGTGNFVGDCEQEEFANLCNDKLIGVRSYPEITQANNYPASGSWRDRRAENGEDYNGHGSHTASTVAGNVNENTPLQVANGEAVSDGLDVPFSFAKTSGVAPRAHIISYQVCWPGGRGDQYAGCPESAILSAFEDAIKDGVDAINFSIGGAESLPWTDPMELSFLSAREAGISVAAAAGNSGPYFWSADHSSPWVTTVGASTHDRVMSTGDKSLSGFEGDAPSYRIPRGEMAGKSYSGSITGEVVYAGDYDDPNPSDGYGAGLCNVPFPEGTFTADQIVLCDRGDIARVQKAINVADGGAGGFILLNNYQANNMVADVFVIPGIQVPANYSYSLKNWIRYSTSGTARATISDYTNNYSLDETAGNQLARFSSMGPSRTNNTLVPDLTAPGVDIYAANADEQPFTAFPRASDWTMMSGTSMAAPHVTGASTLLAQSHPDWTPAEIQSALMMTAKPVFLNMNGSLIAPFYNFMAGAGAIDVAQASKAGLVMDESIENYLAANPEQGGLANWVNVPSMVEMECEQTCSWMRTVTATQDGTWNVTALAKEEGAELVAQPASFTLKAGESQSIVVSMKLPSLFEYKVEPIEPGAPWEQIGNNYAIYNGEVVLTEANGNAPAAHLPVVASNVHDELPFSKEFEFSRNQSSETFRVNTDDYSEFTPRYYGLSKPVSTDVVEKTFVRPVLRQSDIDDGWDIRSVDVPEGTKSVTFFANEGEFLNDDNIMRARLTNATPHMHVGFDENGDGTFIPTEEEAAEDYYALRNNYFDEIVCQSSSDTEANFCTLINPKPGKYWYAIAALSNLNRGKDVAMNGGYAIIANDSDANNITIEGPASHDGNGDYNLTLNWDIADAKAGDVYYGGFDLGNMPGAEGTLGFTTLKLTRSDDAVSWSVSKDKARNMDQIEVNVKINPNMETYDRDYSLNLTIPEGMRLVPSTVKSNNEAIAELLTVDSQTLTIASSQEATRNVTPEYIMTTNLTDEMCHTPLIDEYSTGGYIDLQGEYRMQPQIDWFTGNYKEYMDVPVDWLFQLGGAKFELYNQPNSGMMRMHTVGVTQLNDRYWPMKWHRGPGFLVESIAPFWNGNFEMQYRRHPDDAWGLTLASQYGAERPDLGDLLFAEFDNVIDTATGDEYDFEMILRSGIDYHQGMPEIVYAYDNLGANLAKGGVFVEGFTSAFSSNAGPKEGQLYSVFGFDNLDEVIEDDLVVCFNYDGPERSAVDISFIAVVQPEATGTEQIIDFSYELEGEETKTLSHSISVNANIKVADMADMTVAEDSRIDGIEVMHIDANQVANVLEVTGNDITAEVDGMMFNLIPNADFAGETEVFVTVRDMEHSGDATTTSFMLTVTPSNDMPTAVMVNDVVSITEGDSVTLEVSASDVDGDELTITWSGEGDIADVNAAITEVSGLAVGSYTFTATVSDGIETVSATVSVDVTAVEVIEETKSSSGGGSFGWMLFFVLPLIAKRRKSTN
ncbi:S8 family serine peptidase [Thalassotalea nanhaiensis]|uniref:S8 family serine peptidase n=1 Tax=Thalassotalea nanhaiensis TaxID=3065648 RepID=A0ABY9TGY1_9GAMM|nr:S8 family serine peptidase [Colwelliaceae bacterium SQ345]